MVEPDKWNVSPGTQIKTLLLFPELGQHIDVSAFLFSHYNYLFKFEVNPMSARVTSLFRIKENMTKQQIQKTDNVIRIIMHRIEELKKSVFSRLNNTLTPKEAIALDNKIANYEFMINGQLSKLEPFKKELIKDEFESTIKNYHSSIDEIIEKENKHKTIAKKVEQLYELTPREFEEWTANLFNSLVMRR